MATRKTPAARPTAAKKTAGKGAASKVSAARMRASAAATGDESESLADLLARLGRLELAGLASRLVQGWRKDLETVVQANQRSYAGLQALVEQQMARIKDRLGEIQAVAKVVSVVGPKTSARHLDDLAVASVEMALDDVRQLAAAAAQSQREAFDLVHQRVSANIDEVQRLLRK
jgi:phasin family protein